MGTMMAGVRNVNTFEEGKKLAPMLIKREYGPGTYISNIIENDRNEYYTFNIGVKYPLEIEDSDGVVLGIKNIPDVEKLIFEKNETGRLSFKMIPFSDFENSLMKKDILIMQTLERELIKNTYESLARIPAVANTLTPLMEISNSFRFNDVVNKTKIVKSRRNQNQMENYIKYMTRKGLIIIDNEDIRPTEKMKKYLNKNENLSIPLMAEFLRSGYSELYNFLHLSGLKPYLTIANAYYTPSSEVRSLLRMKIKNLSKYYSRLYKVKTNLLKLSNQVSMMSEVDIFNISNKIITGQQDILDKQIETLSSLSSY